MYNDANKDGYGPDHKLASLMTHSAFPVFPNGITPAVRVKPPPCSNDSGMDPSGWWEDDPNLNKLQRTTGAWDSKEELGEGQGLL